MTNFHQVGADVFAAIDAAEAAFGPVSQLTRDRRAACDRLAAEIRSFGASPAGARKHAFAELAKVLADPKSTSRQIVAAAIAGSRGIADAEIELSAKALLEDAMPALREKLTATFAAELVPFTVTSVRPKVLAAFEVIDQAAKVLPPSMSDSVALRSGGEIEAQWRLVIEAVAAIETAIRLRSQWQGAGWYPRAVRDPRDSFLLIENPFVVDDHRLLGASVFGDFGRKGVGVPYGFESSLPAESDLQLLETSRRGAAWHWPTPDEQSAAAGRWIDAEPAEQLAMAGLAPIAEPVPSRLGRPVGSNDDTDDADVLVDA